MALGDLSLPQLTRGIWDNATRAPPPSPNRTWRQDQKPHTSKQLRVAHILAAENTANAFIVRNHTENKTHQKNIIIRARNWGKYDDKKQFQQLAGPANYCFL